MRGSKLITALIVTNLLLVGAMLLLLRSERARARGELAQTTPHLISYQGLLTDDNGSPINGTRDLTITVYESGTAIVPLWQEVHQNVAVDAGAFAVLLGENISLPDHLFNDPNRWMEVEVDGAKLSPRQRFTSVPYAINADKVDGYEASELGAGDSLPSGAVVWFRDGVTPTGYTRMDALGLDVGQWKPLARSLAFRGADDAICNVWTGGEALCSARRMSVASVGARYDPATDSWTPITTTGAPLINGTREKHSIVWTGSEMIIWGGWGGSGRTNTGGRYDPTTDSRIPVKTTNAPVSRTEHIAVWTGSEMIVWGGLTDNLSTNTGGRYNPASDSWIPVTTTNAPVSRTGHSAVWTGSEMFIWGGIDGYGEEHPGGLYNPATDSWKAVSTEGEPSRSGYYHPLWTGSEMVFVPYGERQDLHFYSPASNTWRKVIYRLSESRDIGPRRAPVVGGDLLITYDGVYDLSQDKWVALVYESVDLSIIQDFARVLWTGDKLLVLGGYHNLSHTIDLIHPYVKD